MYFYALAAAFAAAVFADVYDVVLTEKGLKAGVAVEANAWLVGPKPSAVALYVRDFVTIAAACAPSLLCHLAKANPGAEWGLLIAPVIAAVKHVLGGRAWAKLLAGGKLSDKPLTAWQKFIQG